METVTFGDYFAKQGWYPRGRAACAREIDALLHDRQPPTTTAKTAGIVPHAGWMFSGALAAQVFATLARNAEPDTVVVAAGHLGPGAPGWTLLRGRWPTPLGDLDVDPELAAKIALGSGLPGIGPSEYEPDNSVELQMPLIAHFLAGSRIAVLGVPANAAAERAGRAIHEAARALGRSVIVVGSTDLTHYGPNYRFSPHGAGDAAVDWVKRVNDKRAVDLMCALDGEGLVAGALSEHFCCCPGAAATAMAAARAGGVTGGTVLDRWTSYDIRPGASFVGYAGVVF